jgi:hypothetical protein
MTTFTTLFESQICYSFYLLRKGPGYGFKKYFYYMFCRGYMIYWPAAYVVTFAWLCSYEEKHIYGLPGKSFSTTLFTWNSIPACYFILFYFWCVYSRLVWVGCSGWIESGRLKQNCSGKHMIDDSELIWTRVWSKRGCLYYVCTTDLLCLLFYWFVWAI